MYSFPHLEPVCSMSSSNCCFLTCIQISQEACQVVWYFHFFKNFPQLVVIYTIKSFHLVSEAEADVLLEFACFLYDSMEFGNLISGSSAFSKSSLNIWDILTHKQLKSSLENFEHYFASVWEECNCVIVWVFFGIAFPWDWNENWSFPVLWHCWVFQLCWHIQCNTFTASFFKISNSSAGIPSPQLPLFIWWFLRPTWLCTPGCLALGEWSHHCGYMPHYLHSFWSYFSIFLQSNKPGELIFQWYIFLPFHPVHGVLKGRILKWSLLQWTTFCQNSPPWPIHLGWPYTTWLLVLLC